MLLRDFAASYTSNKMYCMTILFAVTAGSSAKGQQSSDCPDGELDPDVKLNLEFILEQNLKDIIKKYAFYVGAVRRIIEEKGVTPEDLRECVLNLSTLSEVSKGEKLIPMADKEVELEKRKTIIEIFNFLTTKCASFLNYEIFEDILDYYKIRDNNERLKYPEHFKTYIEKHKISEFVKINPMLKKHVNGSKDLALKFDIENTCKLARVIELKKIVARVLKLHPSTLYLVDINDGCVVVTFHIPASVADAIFTSNTALTIQQEEELQAASVLWLKCNGHTFKFEEKLKEEVHTKKISGM